MSYQITHVRYGTEEKTEKNITHYKYADKRFVTKSTMLKTLNLRKGNDRPFVQHDNSSRSYLRINGTGSNRYAQTIPDDVKNNNLEVLPEF